MESTRVMPIWIINAQNMQITYKKEFLCALVIHFQTVHSNNGRFLPKPTMGELLMLSAKNKIILSPHFSDLSPPDYFLWGCLKHRVYVNQPQSLADLKAETTREVIGIPRQYVKQSSRSLRKESVFVFGAMGAI